MQQGPVLRILNFSNEYWDLEKGPRNIGEWLMLYDYS